MKEFQGNLKAFQRVIEKWKAENLSTQFDTFSEDFAFKRFLKKFQNPDHSVTDQLKQKCWDDWADYDQSISNATFYPRLCPELWKARLIRPSSKVPLTCSFPNGSEFVATVGQNSIESRLSRSKWTITAEAFDRFVKTTYVNKALKRAVKRRYENWYQSKKFSMTLRQADNFMFARLKSKHPDYTEQKIVQRIWAWKVRQIVIINHGGRFSSVPKNNDVRRPIIIENIGNMILQKQVGDHLRSELLRVHSVDLDSLQEKHRKLIARDDVATIDLKNASDSISLALVKWFLPKSLFKLIEESRSSYVLGPDGAYHEVRKVSSMGNGYTFELMTWILTSVVRVLDPDGSVYGDDIIIKKEFAPRLLTLLNEMGFVVNVDKTFITGPFRESCGGNYHDSEGYVESYDLMYPECIHDCVVFFNKVLRLSKKYNVFSNLHHKLLRHAPKVLQGPIDFDFFEVEIVGKHESLSNPKLSGFFRVNCKVDTKKVHNAKVIRRTLAGMYNYEPHEIIFHGALSYNPQLVSATVSDLKNRRHWAKYEMYLYSGRRAKDTRAGFGSWVLSTHVSIAGSTVKYRRNMLT